MSSININSDLTPEQQRILAAIARMRANPTLAKDPTLNQLLQKAVSDEREAEERFKKSPGYKFAKWFRIR